MIYTDTKINLDPENKAYTCNYLIYTPTWIEGNQLRWLYNHLEDRILNSWIDWLYFPQHSPSSWNECSWFLTCELELWTTVSLVTLCSYVDMWAVLTTPQWTFSCMRWQSISICLVPSLNTEFDAMWSVAWLSQYSLTCCVCLMPKSCKIHFNQVISASCSHRAIVRFDTEAQYGVLFLGFPRNKGVYKEYTISSGVAACVKISSPTRITKGI